MAQEMSEVFWGLFLTTTVGLLLALGKICYKSKCSSIEFCCFKIVRNIEAEVKEDIEIGSKDSDENQSKK